MPSNPRLSAAYSSPDENSDHARKRLEFIASAYDPAYDDKAEHMARVSDRLSPSMRMALGYHESARDAANQLAQEK